MFYNEGYEYTDSNLFSLEGISESPYELGLAGGLMHVYENECNWNKLVKSVGLAEMKYARETGQDLFLNEAGAFRGFLDKVKGFFKKVIEKIKQIFKQFMAKINSYSMTDKQFLKKYRADINRVDLQDMEFNGYEKMKLGMSKTIGDINGINFDKTSAEATAAVAGRATISSSVGGNNKDKDNLKIDGTSTLRSNSATDSDKLSDLKEEFRGKIIGKDSMDESEFRDELHEMFYGDKETFDVTDDIRSKALSTIDGSKEAIKTAEKKMKETTGAIDKFIKKLENIQKDWENANKDKGDQFAEVNKKVSNLTNLWRSLSNDYTIAYSTLVTALKDCNRQAKALCVKILGYKKKESTVEEGAASGYEGIFGNVDFA